MKHFPSFLISLILLCTFGCGNKHQSTESNHIKLVGRWLLVEYDGVEPLKLNDTVCFYTDESYYRNLDESGQWTYNFINSDSLIIYNRGFGEQRFRILKLSDDSLILQLKKNVIYENTIDSVKSESVEKYIRVI